MRAMSKSTWMKTMNRTTTIPDLWKQHLKRKTRPHQNDQGLFRNSEMLEKQLCMNMPSKFQKWELLRIYTWAYLPFRKSRPAAGCEYHPLIEPPPPLPFSLPHEVSSSPKKCPYFVRIFRQRIVHLIKVLNPLPFDSFDEPPDTKKKESERFKPLSFDPTSLMNLFWKGKRQHSGMTQFWWSRTTQFSCITFAKKLAYINWPPSRRARAHNTQRLPGQP